MAHPYQGRPPDASRLLLLPVEIRLQILRHLVYADPFKFCPHTRLPLLVFSPVLDGRGTVEDRLDTISPHDYPYNKRPKLWSRSFPPPIACHGANRLTLSVFRVNRKVYEEAIELFYSENTFYLEKHFSSALSQTYFAWHEGEILPVMLSRISTKYLGPIRKIGFSVIDNSAIEHDGHVWQDLRAWIKTKLPNLQHMYLFLFGPSKPSQRFLVNIVRLLDSIPGQKTIEYRASNNRKRMVGNTLAQLFKSRRPDAPSIRVLGGW
ncbi:MAG: hypothetical protein LQ343_002281 [Gyalolechia ehrenbergii]|nr:MAG: hypothetical protein LQ343_002281 [Gyalolechia ehrenbergii]